jgi:hypothetical protein
MATPTTGSPSTSKDPRRVAAGRRAWLKRGPLTPEGREKIRENNRRVRPWEYSTGPRTAAGRARSALNGKIRQKGRYSIRELQRLGKDIDGYVAAMRKSRGSM